MHVRFKRIARSVVCLALSVSFLFACQNRSSTERYEPAPASLKRLTAAQLENSLHDLYGESLVLPVSVEADVSLDDSVIVGTSQSGYSARGVELSREMAGSIAAQVLSEPLRGKFLACSPSATRDDSCAASFIAQQGRLLWRRPLGEDEISAMTTVAGQAAVASGDFFSGLRYAMVALLMSPDFLFRTELGESGTDLASRLSFFLWNATPDSALLDAASAGELDSQAAIEAQIDRMLADGRARRGVRAFLDDWLQLARLSELVRDTNLFPSFSPDLGPSAREEVLRTGEYLVFDRNADFRDWLTSRETFVNRRLAALYGVPFPVKAASLTEFALVTLPEDGPRAGLLGSAAFLAANSHPTTTSPTVRGRYMSQVLLCIPIPDPPVGLNTGIPEPDSSSLTLRDRVLAHLNAPGCKSCHERTDPQGLGFEAFDAIGRFRTEDSGRPIDASGEWNGHKFKTMRELATIVRSDERFASCVARRLFRYAHARSLRGSDAGEMDRLTQEFSAGGYRVLAVMRSLAASSSFRRVGAPVDTEQPEVMQ